MNGSRYAEWMDELAGMPLFADMVVAQILEFLELMQAEVRHFDRGELLHDFIGQRSFGVFLRSYPSRDAAPRLNKWSMPQPGEPGFLMGELPLFSQFRPRVAPFGPRPCATPCDILFISCEVLFAGADERLWAVGGMVIRNLLGILAQKAMDIRRELFKLKFDVDIYDMTEAGRDRIMLGRG